MKESTWSIIIASTISALMGALIALLVYIMYLPGPKIKTAKEFLFYHPEVKLQLNSKGKIYDRYSASSKLKVLCSKDILAVFINNMKNEVLLSYDDYHQIGKTNYHVKLSRLYDRTLKKEKGIRRPGMDRRHGCPAKLCEDGASHVPNRGESFDLEALDRQMVRYYGCYLTYPGAKEKSGTKMV